MATNFTEVLGKSVDAVQSEFLAEQVTALDPKFYGYHLPSLEAEKLIEGILSRHFQVLIEFLQDVVNPRSHESLDAFGFRLNPVDIGEFVLMGAVLISR